MKYIKNEWKNLSSARKVTSRDIATLCIYKSLQNGENYEGAIVRLKKSFSEIKNTNKLNNGVRPYGTLLDSVHGVKYSQMLDWFPQDEKDMLIEMSTRIRTEGRALI